MLRKPEFQTLPLALAALQGQFTTDWDVVMAGSVVSILPMLALYLFAQKYIIQGVATPGSSDPGCPHQPIRITYRRR